MSTDLDTAVTPSVSEQDEAPTYENASGQKVSAEELALTSLVSNHDNDYYEEVQFSNGVAASSGGKSASSGSGRKGSKEAAFDGGGGDDGSYEDVVVNDELAAAAMNGKARWGSNLNL